MTALLIDVSKMMFVLQIRSGSEGGESAGPQAGTHRMVDSPLMASLTEV